MDHRQALAYLDSLEVLGIRPGLDRIRGLLARLGDPQASFPSVLIAGTNGKGSVAADVASILRRAGHAPGVYTSPHLVRFEERIVVGATPIAADELDALISEVRDVIAADPGLRQDPPTYFEATTAIAFLHFCRRRVPIAVLEVGMGGRYDATNVVTPLACAITPVGMDHTQWLGGTLAEIALQKAGILKPGVPAVLSRQPTEAFGVIRAEAGRVGAPLTFTADCEVRPLPGAPGQGTAPESPGTSGVRAGRFSDPPAFALRTPCGRRYPEIALSLRGAHQVDNAVTAVLVSELLDARGIEGLDPRAVAAGLREAVWPGRLELLPGRPDLLLDGAHNPAGCATLAAYLEECQPGRPVVLVFAAMKDKPVAAMLDILCPRARRVIVTALPVPRGEAPGPLERLAAARHPCTAQAPSVDEALRLALEGAPAGGLVVVSGSLYLVGEVKRILAAAG